MRLPWGSADERWVSLKLTRKPQSNQANASQWRMFGKWYRPITNTLGQGLPRRTPGGEQRIGHQVNHDTQAGPEGCQQPQNPDDLPLIQTQRCQPVRAVVASSQRDRPTGKLA